MGGMVAGAALGVAGGMVAGELIEDAFEGDFGGDFGVTSAASGVQTRQWPPGGSPEAAARCATA